MAHAGGYARTCITISKTSQNLAFEGNAGPFDTLKKVIAAERNSTAKETARLACLFEQELQRIDLETFKDPLKMTRAGFSRLTHPVNQRWQDGHVLSQDTISKAGCWSEYVQAGGELNKTAIAKYTRRSTNFD